jgi:hypothetical protein
LEDFVGDLVVDASSILASADGNAFVSSPGVLMREVLHDATNRVRDGFTGRAR